MTPPGPEAKGSAKIKRMLRVQRESDGPSTVSPHLSTSSRRTTFFHTGDSNVARVLALVFHMIMSPCFFSSYPRSYTKSNPACRIDGAISLIESTSWKHPRSLSCEVISATIPGSRVFSFRQSLPGNSSRRTRLCASIFHDTRRTRRASRSTATSWLICIHSRSATAGFSRRAVSGVGALTFCDWSSFRRARSARFLAISSWSMSEAILVLNADRARFSTWSCGRQPRQDHSPRTSRRPLSFPFHQIGLVDASRTLEL